MHVCDNHPLTRLKSENYRKHSALESARASVKPQNKARLLHERKNSLISCTIASPDHVTHTFFEVPNLEAIFCGVMRRFS